MMEQNPNKQLRENKNSKQHKALGTLSRILRWVMLACLLVFVLSASILHVMGYIAPSIHAICPYGGMESFLTFVTFGTFVKKIFLGTFVMFLVTIVLAVVFRRSFCGQICVFGGLQEFFGNLGRKIFKKRWIVPKRADRILRYLKYAVLALTIAMAWVTAELWITPFDPYNALGHLADFNSLLTTYLIGFILLIITLTGSLMFERVFCKYLCPAGALYGIIGKASPYAVRLDKDKCISCGLCNKACPMNVEVMQCKNGKVTDIECINCNECVHACPKKGALKTGFSKKAVLHPLLATILVAALFFGPLWIAQSAGALQILPNKYSESTQETHVEDEEEEESGNEINGVTSGDIKGSMTMKDVSEILGMPIDALYEKLGLPADYPKSSTIKTAALTLGVEFSDLKLKLFE